MLLRFFRINDPYRLLGLFLILFLLMLPYLIKGVPFTVEELRMIVLGEALNKGNTLYAEAIDNTPALAAWFSGWIEWFFGRSLTARHILAIIILFFQASYFGIFLINNKAYDESTYLPSLIFGLMSLFSFDTATLSPDLIASTILLLALSNLFKEIEFRIQREEIILNLGVLLGIASLIVFSYWVFLPGVVLLLFLFTRLTIRKILLLFFGFIFPHTLLLTAYYFWGNLDFLLQSFYSENFLSKNESFISLTSVMWLAAIPIVYFFFAMVMLNRKARFTKYQSQLLQVMLLWMLISAVEIYFSSSLTPHSFLVFIPPLAYLISHYLLLIKRRWIAEFMLWIFLLGIPMTSYAALYFNWKKVDYSNLFLLNQFDGKIKDKDILVLDDDLSAYLSNRPGTGFVNWSVSKNVFTHPEYFENIKLVATSFENHAPEIIIDPNQYMVSFFERIPTFKGKYKKQNIYWKKLSN